MNELFIESGIFLWMASMESYVHLVAPWSMKATNKKYVSILEYRVLKLLSLETDYQRNFQSVYTLPGSVPWLRLICCSINQNRKRLRLSSSCRLHLTFLRLGSVSTDWKFRWESVSELSSLGTLYSSIKDSTAVLP